MSVDSADWTDRRSHELLWYVGHESAWLPLFEDTCKCNCCSVSWSSHLWWSSLWVDTVKSSGTLKLLVLDTALVSSEDGPTCEERAK